jgi:hypothetical protein
MYKMNRAKKSEASSGLDVFLNPGSVAVIGASERPGSWGRLSWAVCCPGVIPEKSIRSIPGPIRFLVSPF